jgi:hypothetical protein
MVENVTHGWIPYQAHNGYIEVFANLGWIGVALLGVVLFWAYLKLVRDWRQDRPASDLMLVYFLIGVISNITEASFFRNMFPVWMVLLLAITLPPIENCDLLLRREASGRRSGRTDTHAQEPAWVQSAVNSNFCPVSLDRTPPA